MKNKRILRCIICAFMVLPLCGCSLAVSDAGDDTRGDRLIGAFITRDFLDLFDMDQYLSDHASSLANGQEIELTYDSRYEGKLYAKIDKSKGNNPADWEISFGNLEGIQMFTPLWTPENEEPYWGTVCTEGVCDLDINYNESDNSEEHSISGTIYIVSGKMDGNAVYYANPVYQTADGKIYTTRGHGFSRSGESGEGEEFSSTISGETTISENGKIKTEKSSVTVRYAVMNKPVMITFLQMDQEHQIIKEEQYRPEEVPEQLAAEKGTEYILVETEKEGLSGKKIVSREEYDYSSDEDVWLSTFCVRDGGIVVKQETRVFWNR